MSSTHLQIALSGALPALLAMWLVDRLDAKRPEPASLRRKVAIFGALSVIPAIVFEMLLSNHVGTSLEPEFTYQGSSFKAFVVAAGVEEACKILVVYWIVWRRPEFDERMDGIIYATRAGLGFALVENVMYLMLLAPTVEAQVQMWILRALLAVPGHALWTGMIGYCAARRRFDKHGLGLFGGYLLAVAFHGLYDLALFAQAPLQLEGHTELSQLMIGVPILLTIIAFGVVRLMARTALRLDDAEAASAAALAAANRVVPPTGG